MKISIDYDQYMRQQRLVGEMAGCLSLIVIIGNSVNKEGIKDLLARYEEEFKKTEIVLDSGSKD